jgi:hypothetical protein
MGASHFFPPSPPPAELHRTKGGDLWHQGVERRPERTFCKLRLGARTVPWKAGEGGEGEAQLRIEIIPFQKKKKKFSNHAKKADRGDRTGEGGGGLEFEGKTDNLGGSEKERNCHNCIRRRKGDHAPPWARVVRSEKRVGRGFQYKEGRKARARVETAVQSPIHR